MTAIISRDGLYRYGLQRSTNALLCTCHKPVLFIGVNPSTADADTDDATIRKMTGFAERWGFSNFMVGNVFAYRATDVRELAQVEDPVGHGNYEYLQQLMHLAGLIVPCWGNESKVPRKWRHQFEITRAALLLHADVPVKCFGLTLTGHPMHPLMLSYSTELREFK